MTTEFPKGFESFGEALQQKFINLKRYKDNGGKVVGTFCSFVPSEMIYAAGAVPVSLCATSEDPILAAERDLPRTLCPLIKASYGHAITDTCPFFYYADFIIGETTCDGKKKMFELLDRVKKTHVMQLPQNNLDPANLPYWTEEVRRLKKELEDFYDVEITEADIREQIKKGNAERQNLLRFFELTHLDPPPITGLEQYNVNEAFGFQYDRDEKNRVLKERTAELEQYWEEELKGQTDNRPRILLTGCPMGGVKQKILKTIEDLGAVIVGFDTCSGMRQHLRMVDEDPNRDPIEAIAEKYLKTNCSVMSPNPGRFDDLDYLIDYYKADAVIEITLFACHTFNLEAHDIGNFVRERSLPYLHIESDYSSQDQGQVATRIEAFLELVRERMYQRV